jgi:hypothetical protein
MTLGFRVKSGWAAAVLLTNSRSAPTVVDSRIVELADPAVPHARQPYHAAIGTAQTDAATVKTLVRGIEQFSRRAIKALVTEYREHGPLRRAAVVVASLTDPAGIGNQHMRAHASEGQLFRRVLVEALERSGMKVRVVLEREVYMLLGKKVRGSPTIAKRKVSGVGKDLERWRAEQKAAAAGAWLVG